jgi:predicted flap endonuclease-1-like 5' DNA nuclease
MTDGNNLYFIIIGAAIVALLVAWLLLRSARRRRNRPPLLSERAPDERPYVRAAPPPPAAAVTDEVATATADLVGDVLRVDTRHAGEGDDLQLLKGVGPKLVARLHALGIHSFAQLDGLSEAEVALLDDRLGPFKGRVARDRLVEQAHYLVRGDIDGFEARFGKLGANGG